MIFEYEYAHIEADQLIDVAQRHGWKEVECVREGVRMIASPDDKMRLILCTKGIFSDERRVMNDAALRFGMWLLEQEISVESD